MKSFRLALDWTPNTNHTGFFVALEKGFYEEVELDVSLRSPEIDNYETTPARLVENGDVDLGIAPSESVLSYNTLPDKPNMVAIAAILQKDASAIVTLKESGIDSAKQLDGTHYASYNARFEDTIIKKMIQNDGGEGKLEISNPNKLGIWNTLLNGKADATWVFMPWEGVLAKHKGIELNAFYLEQYNIPYGYSPVLLAKAEQLKNNEDSYEKFLKASAKGFDFCLDNPKEAIEILSKYGNQDELKDAEFLLKSQQFINEFYKAEGNAWGMMESSRWVDFINWMVKNKLINSEEESLLNSTQLYTNQYLIK